MLRRSARTRYVESAAIFKNFVSIGIPFIDQAGSHPNFARLSSNLLVHQFTIAL